MRLTKLPYADMILKTILALKDRTGSSRYAIKKYIGANWKINVRTFNTQIRLALNREVEKGNLMMVKASFKVTKQFKDAMYKKETKQRQSLDLKKQKKTEYGTLKEKYNMLNMKYNAMRVLYEELLTHQTN